MRGHARRCAAVRRSSGARAPRQPRGAVGQRVVTLPAWLSWIFRLDSSTLDLGARSMGRRVMAVVAVLLLASGVGCSLAAADDEDIDDALEQQATGYPDPYERMNRRTLAFNGHVDDWVISPMSRAYDWALPRLVRTGFRNFFTNLEAPAQLVNDLLQGQWHDARSTVARFTINTVAGFAGFVDTASCVGIASHSSDFGQTLARGGVGSGPYLILPVIGPTTVRDGFGDLVDAALNPAIYLLAPVSPFVTASIEEGSSGFTERAARDGDLRQLRATSVDYYAALRSAYSQNRMAETGERPRLSDPPT
jgi:phospholipid-binding lipoprotein MlaA